MIVRWALAELPGVLDELSISRPLLISTERRRHLQLPVHDHFYGVRAHAEIAGVKAGREAAGGADGLIALGGRYGLPHGTMNAVSLPAALRFNSIAAAGQLTRFGEAIDGGDAVARVAELAALAVSRGWATTRCPGRTCPSWRRGSRSSRRRRRTHARHRRT